MEFSDIMFTTLAVCNIILVFLLGRRNKKGTQTVMTINQKADALATLEIRMDNIRHLLEREAGPEMRVDLNESLEDLHGAYAAISAIETVD